MKKKNEMLAKLRKLRALSEDKNTTKGERNAAKIKYLRFKAKYKLNDEKEEETKLFSLKATNDYEGHLIIRLLYSFGIYRIFHVKRTSKFKLSFYSTKSLFLLIEDDFQFYKEKLNKILLGTSYRFFVNQFPTSFSSADKDSKEYQREQQEELDKEIISAFRNSSWIDNLKYDDKKKKIEGK